MDRREIERPLDAIHQARAAGEPAAMATVVRVKGARTPVLRSEDGGQEGIRANPTG
jgi:hypothetical protein